MTIGFFTPVSFKEPQTLSQRLLGQVDGYLAWGCKRVVVLPGYSKNGREGVWHDSYCSPYWITALKIVSYFTLILPLLALVTKCVLRTMHRFYLLHSSQVVNPTLPLSQLTKDEVRKRFDLNVLPATLPRLREEFSLIPASEVAICVYQRSIYFEHCLLFSKEHCLALDISKSQEVFEALLISSVEPENLDPSLPIKKPAFKNHDGIFERACKKIAATDPNVLQVALENCLKENADFYHFISDDQLSKLRISRFNEEMIEKLLDGLYRLPIRFFDRAIDEAKKREIPEVRARFSRLDMKELRLVIIEGKVDIERVKSLLDWSKISLNDLFDLSSFTEDHTESNEQFDRLVELYRAIPDDKRDKALKEGRLKQELSDQFDQEILRKLMGEEILKSHEGLDDLIASLNSLE